MGRKRVDAVQIRTEMDCARKRGAECRSLGMARHIGCALYECDQCTILVWLDVPFMGIFFDSDYGGSSNDEVLTIFVTPLKQRHNDRPACAGRRRSRIFVALQ
ncbi:hypothetical protein [Paraburkholderia solisilvae]|uniref:hypothetical protein n=1 Tax=Paraburkholderia solisilvae TaxID=624376 RepID=UPI001581FCBF|nr:hypothetical protein [Paraburkholderia solisilvae]